VAKPKGNDAEIYAALKQGHGRTVAQGVRRDRLAIERRLGSTSSCHMFRDQPLQGIGAHSPAVGTREDEILWLALLAGQPFLEHCGDVGSQRSASHLSALSETADVSACAKLHVLAPKRREFTVAEAGLNGQEQQRSIAPPDPCVESGRCDQSGAFFFRQECDRSAFMPLRRDRQDPLAVQRKRRFTDGYVVEEGVQGRQTVVSCPRAVAANLFQIIEELPQEGCVEIFNPQLRRRTAEAFRCELEQQAESVTVSRYGMQAYAELLQ
jgi:hypothetical protein